MSRYHRKERLPLVEGEWIDRADEIFEMPDKSTGVVLAWLKRTYPGIRKTDWFRWLEHCPQLGRAIQAFRVNRKDQRPGRPGTAIIWLREDAKKVAEQLSDANKRLKPIGSPGVWLAIDSVWDDSEFGVCQGFDELKLDQPVSVPHWLKHPHPALDQNVNGGKARFRKPLGSKGRPITMLCRDDFKAIDAWEEKANAQVKPVPTPGWENFAQLAASYRLRGKMAHRHLTSALKAFREQHTEPEAVETAINPETKRPNAYYNPTAFEAWLNGRTLEQAAGPLRDRWKSPRAREKLARHVRFLQFVLTHGYYTARKFGRFLAEPPSKPLEPCGRVLKEKVYEWAREAGISTSRRWMEKAVEQAGVKSYQKKGRNLPTGPVEWFLSAPVIIRPPEPQLQRVAARDTRKTVTIDPDGPVPPDTFRLNGQDYRGFGALELRLLTFLWSKQTATIDDAITNIYGHDCDNKDPVFVSLVKNLRRKLLAKKCPLNIPLKSGFVLLEKKD